MGGSADLSPSDDTAVDGMAEKGAYGGRYLRFGVRRSGCNPFGPGPARGRAALRRNLPSIADYMRPSIRLAALMKLPVIYVSPTTSP